MSKDIPRNSGKAPSVQFYFKDFMADMKEHDPEIVGAWILILCKIWHDNNRGEITKNISQLAKIMQTTEIKTKEFLNYFSVEKIADVTECNGQVTIINRRSKRDHKLKEQNRLRQERYREKSGKYGDSNAVVTTKKHHPSISTSISTSSSINKNNTKRKSEGVLELELNKTKIAEFELGLHAFLPARTIGEKKTYRRLFEHVANQIKAGKLDFTVFDQILELAKKANVEADNPRAWWMYQCKKLTGFEGQSEPKRTKNFDQKKQEALKKLQEVKKCRQNNLTK